MSLVSETWWHEIAWQKQGFKLNSEQELIGNLWIHKKLYTYKLLMEIMPWFKTEHDR